MAADPAEPFALSLDLSPERHVSEGSSHARNTRGQLDNNWITEADGWMLRGAWRSPHFRFSLNLLVLPRFLAGSYYSTSTPEAKAKWGIIIHGHSLKHVTGRYHELVV